MVKSKINSNYTVQVRRRREKRTNYKKRIAYLKSGLTRLVVRPTSGNILLQLVNYGENGDNVLCSVNSKSLTKLGWNHYGGNMPTAYLCGFLIAKKKVEGITDDVIIDFGFSRVKPKMRIFAAIKGAVDAGLNVIVDKESFPTDDRVKGKHISSYLKKPSNIVNDFVTVKSKIMGGSQ